jgi:hypothetical protein
MSFAIQFIPEAAKDYTSFDGSIKKQVKRSKPYSTFSPSRLKLPPKLGSFPGPESKCFCPGRLDPYACIS